MNEPIQSDGFCSLNYAYNNLFKLNHLSIGLVVPIENYATSAVPSMREHHNRAVLADSLGFAALWLRDVPFNVPSFGDAGQIFDPFVYLGLLSATTSTIALGVASIVLPLRHPVHTAKAAASVDVLSGGRLLLGVASGDRPEEYPAMNMDFPSRGARFRENIDFMAALAATHPRFENSQGYLSGEIDLLPKPCGSRIPLLITGGSQQSPDWVAQHGDGWMTYPRDSNTQGRIINEYRQRIAEAGLQNKPVMQSLYIDLVDNPNADPRPIHLGFQSGVHYLQLYLRELQSLGVNHVALNLRFNQANIETTLQRLAEELLPEFTN